MFYNQYNNSNCCNSKNNNENNNKVKGYCTVKVIQECCYPSYFDLNEKEEEKCNKIDDKQHNCCCEEKEWNDNNSCHCSKKEESCKNTKRNCGFCNCFRRW